MKYRVVAVGRVREPYVADAVADFRARFNRYERLEELEIEPSRASNSKAAMRDEAERIVRVIAPSEPVWLLERVGEAFSSPELSTRLQRMVRERTSRLNIVIAGTYGAGDPLIERADLRWSLGPLTFLHEWARMIVMEQLYRSAKIARNEPYHH